MFPNYADEDFGEFVQVATLEQVKRNKPNQEKKSTSDLLQINDLKLICQSFIKIMHNYSK